jgi:uncharacterized protein with beta-barrel porin domain
MNRMRLLLLSAASMLVWSAPAFAQTQSAVGPGQIPISATGQLNGVTMTGSLGTGALVVGTVGGPQTDIFTSNSNPTNPLLPAITTDASSSANIVFNSGSTVYGAIGVTQPGGPFFLNVTGGNTGTTLNFQGAVFATTLNVTGTGTVNFNSGATNIAATNFAADGTINLAPNSILIGALTTTAGSDTGTLSMANGSVLNGGVGGAVGLKAIDVTGGSNLSASTATITGAVDTYTLSLGTNTLNVGGALTLANAGPGGVINTTLASPTLYGKVNVTGTTNLGPTLNVNVTVPSGSYLPVGSQFDVIATQSGTNGSVVVVVNDPSNPLYKFAPVPLAGTVNGQVTLTLAGSPLTSPLAPTPGVPLPSTLPIATPIVPVLVNTPSSPDLNNVLAAIDSISNPSAVVNAIAQLAPSTSATAAGLVTFQGARAFQDLWTPRAATAICDNNGAVPANNNAPSNQDPSCRGYDQRGSWSLKGFGYFGNQGAQGAYGKYNSRILGAMLSYDLPLDANTNAGLGIGYSHSNIDGAQFNDTTRFNSYRATAYVGHQNGPWFIYGDASLGLSDYTGDRSIVFPGIDRSAHAKYDGHDITGYVNTGYNFYAGPFTLTPLASLQYTHVSLDSYNETGAGAIDLRVQGQHYDFLESSLGAQLAREFSYGNGGLEPNLHFKWLHELSNPTFDNTATFAAPGSPAFTTPGMKTADNTFDAGGGLKLISCACNTNNWSIDAVYDHYWRNDNYTADKIMLQFTDRL